MRRLATVAVLSLLFTAPVIAQTPQGEPAGPGMGQRRFQPPPDHWMTIDSLSQALALTADQRTKVTPAYTALNGVMKDAAARRQAIRQQMQASGGGGFTPGQEPTPAQRARMDSIRTEMEGFQAEADQWVAAIRNNLTPAQQVKFDSLPKPRLAFRRPGGGPPQQ
jgi:Spy/CpxP family protein refolding chaperone